MSSPDYEQAIAEVDRLQARVKELEAERSMICYWLHPQPSEAPVAAAQRYREGWQEAEQENERLRAALRQAAVALGEAVRSLRAWANPTTGMGANISQEDRGRWQLALREYERARPLIDAALAQPEAAPKEER